MTEWLEALLPQWGPLLLAASAFLSCLMVPLPTSALLIAAGALGGTGHLDLPVLVAGAWLGAAAGDLTAFSLAHRLGPRLEAMGGRRKALFDRARQFITHRGPIAVFLARWLITPLGPASNYVAGATGMKPARFVAASVPGEFLWVVTQMGAGYLFSHGFRGDVDAIGKCGIVIILLLGLLWLAHHLWHRHGRPTI
ncbi:DedA family protein [Paracoccus zhejiangensis]|uniref:VTT domain-containing protein n=1 Tax=Paracoccus zhejiangensis TaxID=1077935 RepID=A0A2H5EWE4_9RHOB|nr:VTT domain-containing protein [Paracoccus zhejiangensis]AUH63612.1 hypothetical protein CX676_05065 [Paracoccus zhejiangensis]